MQTFSYEGEIGLKPTVRVIRFHVVDLGATRFSDPKEYVIFESRS